MYAVLHNASRIAYPQELIQLTTSARRWKAFQVFLINLPKICHPKHERVLIISLDYIKTFLLNAKKQNLFANDYEVFL